MSDIEVDELARRLGEFAILDVRTVSEYDGSGGQPCDPRQGHIPGAVNFDVNAMFQMSPDEVRAAVGLDEGAEVVAYCHSGSRSAMAVQVLGSLGFDARNYVGSWHEWSRHDDLPLQ